LPNGEQQPSGHSSPSLPVEAGGGLTNTPETSTASFWLTIVDPVGTGERTVGTTTRCDQGKVAASKCDVIRQVPGSS
jgi:hypothetical protein